MATLQPFLHAGFLHELEQLMAGGMRPATWPAELADLLLGRGDAAHPTPAAASLIQLLHAQQAVLQAALRTGQVADELRRYQKFVKPGRPSPHIVQLRQQQAAARQASSQSRQSLMKAATAFVREAGIERPARQSLDVFMLEWLDSRLPMEATAPN
ncbi:hypothetical protein [Rhodanobacter ginsengiterrae]|uniref:hypothetical protein n=1 Tax=Rhodanobacter ginsengiterrae TaxID=2008451 RepID=UPI003CF5BB61